MYLEINPVEVAELTRLASAVIHGKTDWFANLSGKEEEALLKIIRVGASAGGQRAKAVIAWNPTTGEVRSGQVTPPKGFESWLLKFDGISDDALGDPQGYGRVEFAYHLMAKEVGIDMTPCRLLEENGRAHFMTKRFDRTDAGDRFHMQSLCALAHHDFNAAGEYGYEQAFPVMQALGLAHDAKKQMFLRMVFNVVACNQDDHTRNIAFLMDHDGTWSLAPAYDIVWSYNPEGKWTNQHQMSINGKRGDFTREDLLKVAEMAGVRGGNDIISMVVQVVSQWREFAEKANVSKRLLQRISPTHRLKL